MASPTTRLSLLVRLKQGDDPAAWHGLEEMYRPMLIRVCRARGLQPADADDVVQNVFVGLVRGLRAFEYDPAKGRFRDYLGRCLLNAMADWARRRGREVPASNHAAEPGGTGDVHAAFEQEWVDHHYRAAVAKVLETCDPRSVEIFQAAMAGRDVPQIAATLGMTEAAVYKALSRTRLRLRELIADQLREEDGTLG